MILLPLQNPIPVTHLTPKVTVEHGRPTKPPQVTVLPDTTVSKMFLSRPSRLLGDVTDNRYHVLAKRRTQFHSSNRPERMGETTKMADYRTERDSMGDVQVPATAYYGAQTQRAVENFPISGWSLAPPLIHAMGLVKFACATANRDLDKLTGSGKNPLNDDQVNALLAACREVTEGKLDDQFPVDVFQTGSGTSSN
ncbi:MAG: lyase family protein, partial [Planctomycetota bacterium]|nr:lyase family protein [Planctomycetota bacterium]